MPASPDPGSIKLGLEPDVYVVYLGNEAGDSPNVESDECPWLIADSVSTSAGGERLDTIKCRVDFGNEKAKRIQNTTAPVGFNRQLEVRRMDEDDLPTEVVAWGFISNDGQEIGREEHETITARLDHFVFGSVLSETSFYDVPSGEILYVHIPCVFNPEIDDLLQVNMSYDRGGDGISRLDSSRGNCSVFLDPQSTRTVAGAAFQAGVDPEDGEGWHADPWDLAYAVHWLCWNLNPEQKYIENPTLEELQTVFEPVLGEQFRNIHIPWGMTLPQALDHILRPYGFGWNVVHSLDDEQNRQTNFNFWQYGDGTTVSLFMQKIGEAIDPSKTNLAEFHLDYNIAKLSNQVQGYGGYQRVESTFPLVPAWEQGDDDFLIEDMEVGFADSILNEYVGRKFVLNEAGDYTGFRDWISENGAMPDLIAEDCVVRRRRFWPCISQQFTDEDPLSVGYVVEWWDSNQESASTPHVLGDPGWVKVAHPFQVLHRECGIIFKGAHPPGDLWDAVTTGTGAYPPPSSSSSSSSTSFDSKAHQGLYLRITACVDSDVRLNAMADLTGDSPNGLKVPMLMDLQERFKYRERQEGSLYDDTLVTMDNIDDTEDLTDFVKLVRDENDQAQVSLGLTLMTSSHPDYQIGYLIDKVDGRNLVFDSHAAGATAPRLLQIVGINRTLSGNQRTELLLETFELERKEILMATGKGWKSKSKST